MLFFGEDAGKIKLPSSLTYCRLTNSAQTLKERFAEQLPEKIEQIKKLRKYEFVYLELW
jgi:hypothetical protein